MCGWGNLYSTNPVSEYLKLLSQHHCAKAVSSSVHGLEEVGLLLKRVKSFVKML